MNIYYHPLDKKCKSKTGAVADGESFTLNVYAQRETEEDKNVSCVLEWNKDGNPAENIEMRPTPFGWTITLCVQETGLYFYRFSIGGRFFGKGKLRGGKFCEDSAYQLTVYDKNYHTPDWFKGGLMYQIFPDRFAKEGEYPVEAGKILRSDWGGTPEFRPNEEGKVLNNDFFGGNIRGIVSKLDYLKSLCVTVIYLNPIFRSASNHRYDTGNYREIDPLLGTEEDFKTLISEAKKRGIRVILDGVFNHTGDDSLYFNRYGHYDAVGAYQSKNSPYYDWYNFFDYPNGYESWWGITTLPAVNEQSASYRNFLFGKDGVIKHWLHTGISGYRLDVADELPDFFLKELRTAVKEEAPNALIIGEVWEDASNKIAYGKRREYFQGGELDSVMNYPLKEGIIGYVLSGESAVLLEAVDMLIDNYPKQSLHCLMNILSTHDTCRILTVLGGKQVYTKEEMSVTYLSAEEKERAVKRLKTAAVLQYTLPGVPCLYYGDENGMEGYIDPFCRRCFDWEHLNQDLISFYRKLGGIRRDLQDIFSDGDFYEVFHDESMVLFARRGKTRRCYVYVNNCTKTTNLLLDGTFEELISGQVYRDKLTVTAYSYGILLKK